MGMNDPMIGTTLGDYQVVARIGKGGMSTVYEGIHTAINRKVAIKILPQTFVHDEKFMERFRREAQLAAQLEHFHILPIYDYGEHHNIPFIVMRYLEGGTLQELIQRQGAQSLEECLSIMEQVASALDHAHRSGVIHRDLKPSNIMFDADGNAYLADFGIAGIMETTSNLTGSGVVGTPTYMSPEQSNSATPSPAMDIYSLGITLFEMLTGEVPFKADTPIGVMMQHLSEPPPSARVTNPKIPPAVDLVLGRALAKYPEDRYQSASELTAALRRAIEHPNGQGEGFETVPSIQRVGPRSAQSARGERLDETLILDTTPSDQTDQSRLDQTTQAQRLERPGEEKRRLPIVPLLLILVVLFGGGGAFVIFADPFGLNLVSGVAQAPTLTPTEEAAPPTATPTLDAPTATPEPTAEPITQPEATAEPTAMPTPTPEPSPTPEPTTLPASTTLRGIRMLLIPAGTFTQGAESGRPNERPEREVYLDAYYIDETEVTNLYYSACVQEGGCDEPEFVNSPSQIAYYGSDFYADYPIIYSTWFDAQQYCEWRGGHLPTEAQWEKAARHDPTTDEDLLFPWGSVGLDPFYANYYPTRGETVEVKRFPAGQSPYGLYEMAGNVAEWVFDWYQDNYYEVGPSENPTGPQQGEFKVFRGGSYDSAGSALTTTYRDFRNPATQDATIGFRCAFTPSGPPQ